MRWIVVSHDFITQAEYQLASDSLERMSGFHMLYDYWTTISLDTSCTNTLIDKVTIHDVYVKVLKWLTTFFPIIHFVRPGYD